MSQNIPLYIAENLKTGIILHEMHKMHVNYMFMHIKKIFYCVSLLTLFLIPSLSLAQNISVAAKPDIKKVRFDLEEPLDIDVLINAIGVIDFEGLVLEGSFKVDNQEIYDFHLINESGDIQSAAENYRNSRAAFIRDIKNTTEISEVNRKQLEDIKILKVQFIGEDRNIDRVKKNLSIKKTENMEDSSLQEHKKDRDLKIKRQINELFFTPASAAGAQFYPMYQYLPESGTSILGQSSLQGERYSMQYMTWNNNYFDTDETYEHKLYLYNYDGKTYLNNNSSAYPQCMPVLTYAAATWGSASKPYVDTRFPESAVPPCEQNELSFTIGAAQADQIQTGVLQYVYMRTLNGNDSTDKYKLQGQVGYRYPVDCFTTWCAAKHKIYNLIPSWSNAPANQEWTFNGISPQEAPSNLSITGETSTSLNVNFTDNTFDETSMRIERQIPGNGWQEVMYTGLLSYTGNWFFSDVNLQSNMVYCYRLRMKNDLGYSGYSDTVCGATQTQ